MTEVVLTDAYFSRKDPERFPPNANAYLRRDSLPTLEYIPVRTKDGRWMHARQ